MEALKMNHLSDSLLAGIASVTALAFSQITLSLEDDNLMRWITSISSIVLCLTAIIKLIDLCVNKLPKWYAYLSQRFRKPPTI